LTWLDRRDYLTGMRQWTVDAFASEPFKGNPACVVEPFDQWPDDAWMHSLAAENNQAETAFLLKTREPGRFGLRWMTPRIEVPLCGHATLASAHVLATELGLDVPEVVFDTRSGPLTVTRRGSGYEMDFPARPAVRLTEVPGLEAAIGAAPAELWAANCLVAVLGGEAEVRALEPDISAVFAIATEYGGGRGDLLVTALADAGRPYDVVSRFFAPGAGIAEDPTTGSAHCILSPLFSDKLGRSRLRFHQAYPGRGGDLEAEHRGDRVLLAGSAVTVLEGRLRLRF
jgi:predicted PhzF superfamily epimerase YddE/YHI9